MTLAMVQTGFLDWTRRLLRLLLLAVVAHALLFALFDTLPSVEFKLGGWMVADPAALRKFRSSLGTSDAPLHERYFVRLGHLFRGDLGKTVSGYPVASVLATRFSCLCLLWLWPLRGRSQP